MFKCASESVAKEIAKEKSLCYGWSIFMVGYYVGTKHELYNIGCIEPKESV